jgi:hypothetical protein
VFVFDFDLSDYTAEFILALNGTEIIKQTVGDGIAISTTQLTVDSFTVPPADGRGATNYNYELTLTSDAGVRTTYVKGNIKVQGDVLWSQ